MNAKIEKLLNQLADAISEALEAERTKGKADAAQDALARVRDALGVVEPVKRGRKPKA
jgi:hypothetical protein